MGKILAPILGGMGKVNSSSKKSKNRLIYDLKSDLNLEQSNDLFKSILNNFY